MAERRETLPHTTRRLAGAAGLGYVVGVAIENMEVLSAPTIGSSAADIRSFYEDQAFSVVTSFAGALALLFYFVFVAAMFNLLRSSEPRRTAPLVALVGGIGGPLLASVGLAANAVLVAKSGANLSDDLTRSLSELNLIARMVSGIFVSLFLVGTGVSALRSGVLPAPLAWFACAIGGPIALAPLAALTGDHVLGVMVAVAFGFAALWVFLTSLWLALDGGIPVATFVRRAAFLVLVVAAGLVGIAMVAVPAATANFFSWRLEPEPLAAFAGGVYVGSAAVYAAALRRPWRQVRGLVVGAVVLSISVFVVTLAHLDIFDLDRLQAWAWIVLFAGFSLVTIGILVFGDESDRDGAERGGDGAAVENVAVDAPLARWARVLLASVAALLGALAVALWIDPTGLAGPSPFELPPLGGRFAGCWIALLAVLTGWAAVRHRSDEARLPALALVTLPAGALVAALRTVSDLEPAGAGFAYLVALVLLIAAGAVLIAKSAQPR